MKGGVIMQMFIRIISGFIAGQITAAIAAPEALENGYRAAGWKIIIILAGIFIGMLIADKLMKTIDRRRK